MKKAGKVILLLAVVAAAGIGGWFLANASNKQNNDTETKNANVNTTNAEERVSNSDTTENTDSNKKSELTVKEMYNNLINDYKKAMSEYDQEDVNSEENIAKKYDLVSSSLITHVNRYKEQGTKLTYSIYDIDKNGIKELIVCANEAPGAIYTYDSKEEKPVKIFFQDTLERGSLSIYDNGVIFSQGSGGAFLHYYEFGKISNNGTSYEVIEKIEEEYTAENSNPTYKDYKTRKTLNYKNLDEIKDKYLSNSQIIKINNTSEI